MTKHLTLPEEVKVTNEFQSGTNSSVNMIEISYSICKIYLLLK